MFSVCSPKKIFFYNEGSISTLPVVLASLGGRHISGLFSHTMTGSFFQRDVAISSAYPILYCRLHALEFLLCIQDVASCVNFLA